MELIEGTFKVSRMTCENRIARIIVTIERLPGVWRARGDLATGIFRIACDAAQVKAEAIVQAIEQAGKEGAWRPTYQTEALPRPAQR
ncbi:MAG: cation transporter [Ardenticatenaceae bacterium]|nr:cation transporter [Ardenticatenaceae bacterium]